MVSIKLVISALLASGGQGTSSDLSELIGCAQAEVSRKLTILHNQGYLDKYPEEGKRGYISVYVLSEEVEI
jgi:DNA-binding MarR family transcriptional regulator